MRTRARRSTRVTTSCWKSSTQRARTTLLVSDRSVITMPTSSWSASVSSTKLRLKMRAPSGTQSSDSLDQNAPSSWLVPKAISVTSTWTPTARWRRKCQLHTLRGSRWQRNTILALTTNAARRITRSYSAFFTLLLSRLLGLSCWVRVDLHSRAQRWQVAHHRIHRHSALQEKDHS